MAAPETGRLRRGALALGLALLPLLGAAQAGKPVAGQYEGLMVAVSPQGAVTGHYVEEQGEGVVKRCAFSLSGQLAAGGEAAIRSWSSVQLPGRLKFDKEGVTLTLPEGTQHDGCGLVLMPQIATGLALDLVAPAGWTALHHITADKAPFFDTPQSAKPRRAYVVKGDVVGVLAEQDGWVRVEYPAKGKRVAGWLQPGTTAVLTAPR